VLTGVKMERESKKKASFDQLSRGKKRDRSRKKK